jgi:3-dehydroquinate synthase
MIAYTQRFSVAFEYPVYFTSGMFDPENPILCEAIGRLDRQRCHRILVVLDEGVAAARPMFEKKIERYVSAHSDHLALAGTPLMVPGGERAKSDGTYVAKLHRALVEQHIDRQSFVVIIGGGAVQDMAGYAAATAHRGIRVVRVPTTVLGQNDAGVGVKNGINAFGTKNFLGTFAPPFAVIDDIEFIDTLSPRDRRAGIAEAVKVAAIKDRAFFEWLWVNADRLVAFEEGPTAEMIRRSAIGHLEHIAGGGDPFELGSARPLDYGHWAAHKLETLSGHALRHGEGVAIGMALDARYAVLAGLLDEASLERICTLLERLGLALWHEALELPALLDGLQEFREHLGGELTIRMLTGVGRGVDVHHIDVERMRDAIDWLKKRRQR